MTRQHLLRYVAVAVIAAGLVVATGVWIAGPGARPGVVLGAAFGLGCQVALGCALALVFPGRQFLAYGIGMLGRFMALAFAALVLVPQLGIAPAPTLFALVSTLFATTLLEPIVFAAQVPNAAQ